MEFTPTLLWSQTYENIEIEINLPNILNEILKVDNNIFHFECLLSNKKYLIDFELEEEISGHNILLRNDKKMIVQLQKKEEGVKWEFLAKKRGIYKNNIKINWDKWEDSEGEDENEEKNIDMGGMGGMNNMMGGGMDMSMLQEMMGKMGHNGEEGEEEGGEEGGEEGEEEGGEEGEEEGSEEGEEEGSEEGEESAE
jgi:hypothetical protein